MMEKKNNVFDATPVYVIEINKYDEDGECQSRILDKSFMEQKAAREYAYECIFHYLKANIEANNIVADYYEWTRLSYDIRYTALIAKIGNQEQLLCSFRIHETYPTKRKFSRNYIATILMDWLLDLSGLVAEYKLGQTEFLIHVDYDKVKPFMNAIKYIFGAASIQEDKENTVMQNDGICVDLYKLLDFDTAKELKVMLMPVYLVELNDKGTYKRFALTCAKFREMYPELIEKDKENGDETISPMVHIWYAKAHVGDESWNTFFTDMSAGLSNAEIEDGNLARIEASLMEELVAYLP